MSKEKYFRMTMFIACIGMIVDDENYKRIKEYLDGLTKLLDQEKIDED